MWGCTCCSPSRIGAVSKWIPKFKNFERVIRTPLIELYLALNKIQKVLHQPHIFSWNKDIFLRISLALYTFWRDVMPWHHCNSLINSIHYKQALSHALQLPQAWRPISISISIHGRNQTSTPEILDLNSENPKSDLSDTDFVASHSKSLRQIFSPSIQIICAVRVLSTQNQRRE